MTQFLSKLFIFLFLKLFITLVFTDDLMEIIFHPRKTLEKMIDIYMKVKKYKYF